MKRVSRCAMRRAYPISVIQGSWSHPSPAAEIEHSFSSSRRNGVCALDALAANVEAHRAFHADSCGAFGSVISQNAMEHLRDPAGALRPAR